MEKFTSLHVFKRIFEVLGIIAVVISLILVWIETKQNRILAEINYEMTITQNRVMANQTIASHPEVWVKGCANDSLSKEDMAIFRAMVDDRNAIAYYKVVKGVRLQNYSSMRVDIADFVNFLNQNPGAKAVWLDMEESLIASRKKQNAPDIANDWYTSVKTGLDNLDRINADQQE